MPAITSCRQGRIAFDVTGEGFPVLFVPPPVIGREVFHYQKEALSDAFQVIRFDLRGHGESSPSPTRVTYDLIVEDMKALLDALHVQRAVVCGYSMAGAITLEFARKYPERTSGAIVLSGFSEVRDPVLRAELAAAALAARARTTRALAFALAIGNADCKASFRRMWTAGKTAHSKEVADLFSHALQANITKGLGSVRAPVCLVSGGDDKRFHKYGHILRTGLNHSEFHVIPKVAHQLPTKAPVALHSITRAFITACSTPR